MLCPLYTHTHKRQQQKLGIDISLALKEGLSRKMLRRHVPLLSAIMNVNPLFPGDSLRYHSRSRFSTPDVDNDLVNNYSCALNYHAAWWYRACYYSQLNGRYYNSSYVGNMKQAIRWPSWTNEVMKSTQMKMRQM